MENSKIEAINQQLESQDTKQAQQTTGDKPKRGLRKQRVGVVVSDKMDKTIVVMVYRRVRHPKYGKIVTRRKKYMAHDENNEAHIGDTVLIMETRPLSRRKRWRLVKIIEKAK